MRVAFIADIHSNLEALNAVLKHIDMMRIKNILCIGDIVGYGANPNECCEIIRMRNIPGIRGNHDMNALDLQKLEWYNPDAAEALKWTNKALAGENKDFLAKLPNMSSIKIANCTILLVHGSLDNPYEYVFPNSSDSGLQDLLKRAKSDVLALGHTHMPMIKRYPGGLVLNPGAVGQPRDNVPKASYAILDTELMSVTIMRVEYDINTASRKIVAAGLPRYLGERLHKGQ